MGGGRLPETSGRKSMRAEAQRTTAGLSITSRSAKHLLNKEEKCCWVPEEWPHEHPSFARISCFINRGIIVIPAKFLTERGSVGEKKSSCNCSDWFRLSTAAFVAWSTNSWSLQDVKSHLPHLGLPTCRCSYLISWPQQLTNVLHQNTILSYSSSCRTDFKYAPACAASHPYTL